MKILLIDTCGEAGSVAISDTGAKPSVVTTAMLGGRTASERLLPAIKQLAADSGVPLQSLNMVVVVHGPGSFTGVRVGLSAAKGLCEALELPMIAISRLAVLAAGVELPTSTPVLAVLDAGRGEFYAGLYADGTCFRETLLTRDEILAAAAEASVPEPVTVVCEPAVAEGLAAVNPLLITEPTAKDALPLALRRTHEESFDDAATLDANYLRRTDAEIFAKPGATARSLETGNQA
jgi:tRNA threonylcarbamoyladenosine biosynthesis protein TsaB